PTRPRIDPQQHRHRLGGRRRFVEQRRVGDLHPRQLRHHRLEIEERFEAALGDFGLIRCVGRVPAGVFEDVADDDAWRDAAVVAETEVRAEHLIPCGDVPHLAEVGELGDAVGNGEGFGEPDRRRKGFVDERVEGGHADDVEHGPPLSSVGTNMARREAHLTSASYFAASSRPPASPALVSFTAISQLPCGSAFTCSGLLLSASFTSTTSPDTGEYSSETAFTDSIVPNDCPCVSLVPTAGRSTKTTSPSCFCA